MPYPDLNLLGTGTHSKAAECGSGERGLGTDRILILLRWVNFLISLYPNFFICKMGTIIYLL